MNAALKFRVIRATLKISQKQLAKMLGIEQVTLHMIEITYDCCELNDVQKLFDLLNVKPTWFFQDKGEMFTNQPFDKESRAQLWEKWHGSLNHFTFQGEQKGWLTKAFSSQKYDSSAEQVTPAETSKDKADLLEALILLEEFAGRKTEELRNELAYTDAALLVISQHVNQKYPLEKLNIDCRLQHDRTQLAHIQIINL